MLETVRPKTLRGTLRAHRNVLYRTVVKQGDRGNRVIWVTDREYTSEIGNMSDRVK
jgi:hypothetical protein